MKALVNRAAVLYYLSQSDAEALLSIADCFGYQKPNKSAEQKLVNPVPETKGTPPRPKPDSTAEVPVPTQLPLPKEMFYVLTANEPSSLLSEPETEQQVMPEWVAEIAGKALDLNAPSTPARQALPPLVPLVAWARLWPVLRQILSVQSVAKRPDLAKLVKQVAKGELIRHIPYQKQQRWVTELVLLQDRPERLAGLAEDYDWIEQQVRLLRGTVGIESRFLLGLPGDAVLVAQQEVAWRMPAAGTAVLILSDLGIYAPQKSVVQRWLAFGRALQAAGCVAYVLIPAPVRYIFGELTQYFRCISWDRFSALQVLPRTSTVDAVLRDKQQQASGKLVDWLSLLSVSVEIAPRFIRAMRYQLPLDRIYDVASEVLVWNHPHVERTSCYIQFKSAHLAEYRLRLVQRLQKNPALAQALYGLIQRLLADECYLDYYDAIALVGFWAGRQDDAEYLAAECYLKQFILATHEQTEHRGLLFGGYYLLARQAEPTGRDKAYWSSLWGILKRRLQDESSPRPEWLNHAAANAFVSAPQREAAHYVLYQRGEWLCIASKDYVARQAQSEFQTARYVLANVATRQPLVVEALDGQYFDHPLSEGQVLCLPLQGETRRLHVAGRCLTVTATQRPAWAGAVSCGAGGIEFAIQPSGEDKFGVYFDWAFQGVTQRFRYIPPTTFLMGSPPDEPERRDDETQHEVTLTRGYWLADSTVTQALWQAVMGSNPSRFKGGQLPVDTVSWEDAQNFIRRLNLAFPFLVLRLPTEAEWECACRAGSNTPFSFGMNISPAQVNYDGNYPYHEGKKGVYRKKSVAVKSLPPNAWGLYEMHGNVWEWCSDRYGGDYVAASQLDPTGASTGEHRVLRGGSWFSDGWYCRSADRSGRTPDFRFYDIGFRFALGHGSSGTERSEIIPQLYETEDSMEQSPDKQGILGWLWNRIRGKREI